MHLENVSAADASEFAWGEHFAVITCGATEQHGPHLPLGTDTIIGWALAQRLAKRVRCILAPAISVGCSNYHMSWPGTITLSPDTLVSVIYDIAASFHHHGTRHLLIINSHGGNRSSVDVAASRVMSRLGLPTVVAYFQGLAYKSANGVMDLGHGGHIETSVVLQERPDLVNIERAEGGTDLASALARERGFSARDVYRPMSDWSDVSPEGWFGDAAAASAEDGNALLDRMVKRVTAYLEDANFPLSFIATGDSN